LTLGFLWFVWFVWVIEFIEFVGLVELVKFVITNFKDDLWMTMVFQKVFIG